MSNVTVRQLADAVGISLDRLLGQLVDAGLTVDGADDVLNDDEKGKLLSHLREAHGKDSMSSTPKKITLKRKTLTELKQGRVPGHGSRTVAVEVRKRRTYVKKTQVADVDERSKVVEQAEEVRDEQRKIIEAQRAEQRKLKEQERQQRQAEVELEAKRIEEARKQKEKELEEHRNSEEEKKRIEAQRRVESEQKERNQNQAQKKLGDAEKSKEKSKEDPHRKQLHVLKNKKRKKKRSGVTRPAVSTFDQKHAFEKPTAPIVREVAIAENISVFDLAQKMSVKAAEVIKVLMGLGIMATINQTLDQETAGILVEEMGHKVKLQSDDNLEAEVFAVADSEGTVKITRPPVVTIMGHVDHGKTSLLDYIRNSRIAAAEAGGITQHIGAYRVNTNSGSVTFLDTPGHAAFTAMRARGAQVTDIVIIVVAADDGVMPQTKEAIEHARAAKVPIIIAVNKIDKPEADPERVKQELAALQIVPEEWGGDIQFINMSAKSGEGVNELIDSLLLQAEILELRAPIDGAASGVAIESRLDKGRGPVATVLVRSGVLRRGDIILCGEVFGRIRAMFNENGKPMKEAEPSSPVEVLGLSGIPSAGDDFVVVPNERIARELALRREEKSRSSKLTTQQATKLEEVFANMESGVIKDLNLIIKADVQGSLEALRDSLIGLSNDEIRVKVVSGGVGGINEGDVNLALTSNAIMIGFNVRADMSARKLIEEKGIDLRYYSVIYNVIDEVRQSIGGMLEPEVKEQIVGIAGVRDVFRSPKFGAIAGCMILEGFVARNLPIRVLRDNVVIYEGQLESLRRFKDDVSDVKAGMECGIGVKNYNDVKEGDQIEVFERVEVQRTI